MKKKIFKFLLMICLMLPFAFLFIACGDEEVKLTGIEFENSSVTFSYREIISADPFGTTLIFSDGSRKSINDVTEEDVPGLTMTLGKFNMETNQYDEIDFMQYFPVGSYRVTYDYNDIHGSAYFSIEKGTYTGTTYVNLNTYNMTYGGLLSKPTAYFTSDTVVETRFYYQTKTNDNSYSESYMEYNYQDNKICEIQPGDYQMYAVIVTENYEDIKTPLRQFTVSKATKNNYALFSYDSDAETYTKLTSSSEISVSYQFENEKLLDYVQALSNVYVCEINQETGNIALGDDGNPLFAYSLQNLAGGGYYSLENDPVIGAAGKQNVTLMFTSNNDLYKTRTLSFKLNIEKLVQNVSNLSTDNVEYDGQAHYISYSGEYEEDNGKYYGIYSYTLNEQAYKIRLFEITNFVRTNAGTYQVWANLLNSVKDSVILEIYNSNSGDYELGDNVLLGSWTIAPKQYSIEAHVTLNGVDVEEYFIDGSVTLLYDEEYEVEATNIEAYYHDELDETVTATLTGIEILDEERNKFTAGVTIEGNKVTISSNAPEWIIVRLIYSFENVNYANFYDEHIVVMRTAQTWTGVVYGEIQNWKNEHYFKFIETSWDQYNVDQYYVSVDGNEFIRWESVRESLYVDEGESNYVLNDSNYIDWNKEYFVRTGSDPNYNYTKISFYYIGYEDKQDVQQTGNKVTYDGYYKSVGKAYIALTDLDVSSWASNYNNLYVSYQAYEPNNSPEIDWSKGYYKKVGEYYYHLGFYYYENEEYISSSMVTGEVTEWYVFDENYLDPNNPDLEDSNKPKLFTEVYGDLYTAYTAYSKNSNSAINWDIAYYKKVGEEYVIQYFYYEANGGYVRTNSAIDGVSSYFISDVDLYISFISVEKYDDEHDSWNEVAYDDYFEYSVREVGKYRVTYSISLSNGLLLVDEECNIITQVVYEWEIEENPTKIHIVNDSLSLIFKDKNGNVLIENGEHALYPNGNRLPVYLTLNLILDDPLMRYYLIYQTQWSEEPGSWGSNEASYAGSYVTRIYVILENGVLVDGDDNIIDYIEINWDVICPTISLNYSNLYENEEHEKVYIVYQDDPNFETLDINIINLNQEQGYSMSVIWAIYDEDLSEFIEQDQSYQGPTKDDVGQYQIIITMTDSNSQEISETIYNIIIEATQI